MITNPLRYLLFISLLLALSCTDQETPLARPGFQISDYQLAKASRRFDQCQIRYAFRNKSKTTDPGTLQKELEVPFDRWRDASGYLTFEQVTTATADINIVFVDTLRPSQQVYTSFGLIGQPVGVLSQLVRSKADSSCTIYLSGTYAWPITSLQRVLLFQIGAALGLATSTSPASAMSPLLNTVAVLDSSDRNGVRRAYNKPCDSWTRLKDLPFYNGYIETTAATPRAGYVVLSAFGGGNAFWEYTPKTGNWQSRAPFPLSGSTSNSPKRLSFAIDSSVYVGEVLTGSWQEGRPGLFYKYVPATDKINDHWVGIASMIPVAYYENKSFALNGKGYVVTTRPDTGYHSHPIVWEYDPAPNRWNKPQDLPSTVDFRFSDVYPFTLNQEAYLVAPQLFFSKSWRFNPMQTNPWTSIATFENDSYTATCFSVRDAGYGISGGYDPPKGVWQYKPEHGWRRLNNFLGSGRIAFSFAIGNRAYVGTDTGHFWEYTP